MDKFPGFKKIVDGLPEMSEELSEYTELRDAAPAQVDVLLAERVPQLSPEKLAALSGQERIERIDAKIAAIRVLKDLYDVAEEGSRKPVNNAHRFLVKEIHTRLDNEIANRELIDDFEAIGGRVDRDELKSLLEAVMDRHRDAA